MPRPVRTVLLLCYALLLATHLYYPKWQQDGPEATLSYDVSGYYLYLPATLIYADLREVAFLPEIIDRYHPTHDPYQVYTTPEGDRVMKYSLGQSLLYVPAFLVAHAVASTLDAYPADGFSRPYQLAISLWSLLVSYLGLYLVARLLLRYFASSTTCLTLLLLVVATNYLNYAAIDGAMTHNYLFTLYALLLLGSDGLYRRVAQGGSSGGLIIGLGAVVGLMALVRPTEILAAVLPVCWGMAPTLSAARARSALLVDRGAYVVAAVAACMAVGSLQLFYWHYVTGDWLVYSYQDQGFSFLSPHLHDGLLSYRAGWLVYTPLMVLALLGITVLYRYRRSIFLAVALHAALFIYVTFAWDVWWYGGSLGQRAMVQAYAVLSLPLAAAVSFLSRTTPRKVFLVIVAVLCGAHNLWFTHQAHRGGLFVTEWMNNAYYWHTLFTFEVDPYDKFLLDNQSQQPGHHPVADTVYRNGFEAAGRSCPDLRPVTGGGAYCMSDSVQSTPEFTVPGALAPKQYVGVTGRFRSAAPRGNIHNSTQLVVRFYRDGKNAKETILRLHRILNREPDKELTMYARAPRQGADEVRVLLWNGGDRQPPFLVDDLRVFTWK